MRGTALAVGVSPVRAQRVERAQRAQRVRSAISGALKV
jgi:hypothetical protein